MTISANVYGGLRQLVCMSADIGIMASFGVSRISLCCRQASTIWICACETYVWVWMCLPKRGKSKKIMFLFLFKIDIMLAKMKVISFHLLKMIKLAPSSGTSSKNVNFYKVNWQVNSSMICSLAHWYIDFIAGYGRNILQSFLQFWICLSKHCLACKIPALLCANK